MRKLLFLFLLMLIYGSGMAQYRPIYHYQTPENSWYDDSTQVHTSLQPYYKQREVITRGEGSYLKRKLLNEHLVQFQNDDYTFTFDFLPDMYIGREQSSGKLLWNNTRGISMRGDVNKKFSYAIEVYENQAAFPRYLDTLTAAMGAIPGQGWNKPAGNPIQDYAYTTGHIAFNHGPFFLQLGNDKNFIGEGYRSMLLSDVAVPYPYFKATLELGRVQYSSIYAQHIDRTAPLLSFDLGYRKKWAVFHYLDWRVTDRFSLGFFDAIVWQNDDASGTRGFDFSYANPVIFLRTVEYSFGSPDNALLGLNLKYKTGKQSTLYGQILFDELTVKEFFTNNGYWANKFSAQLGFKGKDLFKVKNLSGFSEISMVKPYTYSHWTSLKSYTHYNDALAHPLGANFVESVTRLEYSINRIQLMAQLNYSVYGVDSLNGINVGKDILQSYTTRGKDYGHKMFQGISSSLTYIDTRISYLLNPKLNLRFELGGVYRREKTEAVNDFIFTFGLRSSFRNLYFDR